ncbi:TetR/AcrR family transcriptional regulator [Streptomyces sp. NPDC048002]|uniref:TetR/AcrR family transcriptional regulator n=1 Tax=Streptomyces sp. NPDC048002 TaxID=3154344 RepID=UPI0033EC4A09
MSEALVAELVDRLAGQAGPIGRRLPPVITDKPEHRTSKGARTRARIVAAAAQRFDEQGYHGTSLQEIAEAAGISKATIYHHFKTKDEILVEILHTLMNRILDRQRGRRQDEQQSGAAQLQGMIGDLIGLVDQHPAHLRVVLEQVRHLPADVQGELEQGRERFRTEMRDILQIGAASGEFVLDDDADTVAVALLGACWAYFWHPPRSSHDARRLADTVTGIMLQGLRPRT